MRGSIRRQSLWILALAVAALSITPVVAFARVFTDQPSYSPGDVVTISGDNSDGAGYQAGETVHVVAGIAGSYTASCDAVADASGAWSCQVTLPSDDAAIGVSSYTATGLSSGVSQSGTFKDSGCPNSTAIGNFVTSNIVGASFTTSGTTATYRFDSFVNRNPIGGVPGLIEYCVYTSPLPTGVTAQAIGANGAAFTADTEPQQGFFDFERAGGNPSNIPLNGTTGTVMGTATWSATPPTTQTIILHINDSGECSRLYTAGTSTCFVRPGTANATLTLVKVVDHNGTSDTTAKTAWTLTATGPTPLSGAGGASGSVSPGTYTLAESGPTGPAWTSSGFDCGAGVVTTITLNGGDTRTCTVTNTAVPPKLTLVKNVDHSGTTDATPASAWTLKAAAASATQTVQLVSGAGGASGTADIGAYNLSEAGPGAPGWTSSGFDCGAGVVPSVTLALGDNTTCTITNTAVPPKLTVNKVLVPSTDAGKFNLQIDGLTAGTGANVGDGGTTGAVTVLTLGSHTVGETAGTGTTLANYDSVISGSCTATGAVSLALGDVKTCTITNTGKGNLTIVKKTIGGDGTFSVSVSGPTPYSGSISTVGGTGSLGPKRVTTGTYSVAETLPANWVQTSSTCGNVTVPTGGDVTCTITNTGNGKITIVKKATGNPNGGTTFTFPVSGSVVYNGPYSSTQSITTNTLISGTTFRGDVTITVPGGSYSVTENPNGTWVLTGAVCYSGAEQTPVPASAVNNLPPTPATFSITPGSQETCVFENTLPVTRTQGFWATHFNFTNSMWATKVPAADKQIVCGTTVVKDITNDVSGTGTSRLYGGFWSGISKTSAGKARTAVDQARMKLVQQLQAAILNRDVFGAPDNGKIAQAKADYCGTNATAMTNDAGALGSFNQSGEVVPLDPSQFALTPAEPQKAQTTANKAYWDVLP